MKETISCLKWAYNGEDIVISFPQNELVKDRIKIPNEFLSFFKVDDIRSGEEVAIDMSYNGHYYDGYIEKEAEYCYMILSYKMSFLMNKNFKQFGCIKICRDKIQDNQFYFTLIPNSNFDTRELNINDSQFDWKMVQNLIIIDTSIRITEKPTDEMDTLTSSFLLLRDIARTYNRLLNNQYQTLKKIQDITNKVSLAISFPALRKSNNISQGLIHLITLYCDNERTYLTLQDRVNNIIKANKGMELKFYTWCKNYSIDFQIIFNKLESLFEWSKKYNHDLGDIYLYHSPISIDLMIKKLASVSTIEISEDTIEILELYKSFLNKENGSVEMINIIKKLFKSKKDENTNIKNKENDGEHQNLEMGSSKVGHKDSNNNISDVPLNYKQGNKDSKESQISQSIEKKKMSDDLFREKVRQILLALPKEFYEKPKSTKTKRMTWNFYEAALLFEAYLNSTESGKNKYDEITRVSLTLRDMARTCGLDIDSTFRNLNGITMQFGHVQYLFTDGKHGLSSKSKTLDDLYEIYQNDRLRYKVILKNAYRLLKNNKGIEYRLYSWLKNENKYTEFMSFVEKYNSFVLSNNQQNNTIKLLIDHDKHNLKNITETIKSPYYRFKNNISFIELSKKSISMYKDFLTNIDSNNINTESNNKLHSEIEHLDEEKISKEISDVKNDINSILTNININDNQEAKKDTVSTEDKLPEMVEKNSADTENIADNQSLINEHNDAEVPVDSNDNLNKSTKLLQNNKIETTKSEDDKKSIVKVNGSIVKESSNEELDDIELKNRVRKILSSLPQKFYENHNIDTLKEWGFYEAAILFEAYVNYIELGKKKNDEIIRVSLTLRDMARTYGLIVNSDFRDVSDVTEQFDYIQHLFAEDKNELSSKANIIDKMFGIYQNDQIKFKVIVKYAHFLLKDNKGVEYRLYKWFNDENKFKEFFTFVEKYNSYALLNNYSGKTIELLSDADRHHLESIVAIVNSQHYVYKNNVAFNELSKNAIKAYESFLNNVDFTNDIVEEDNNLDLKLENVDDEAKTLKEISEVKDDITDVVKIIDDNKQDQNNEKKLSLNASETIDSENSNVNKVIADENLTEKNTEVFNSSDASSKKDSEHKNSDLVQEKTNLSKSNNEKTEIVEPKSNESFNDKDSKGTSDDTKLKNNIKEIVLSLPKHFYAKSDIADNRLTEWNIYEAAILNLAYQKYLKGADKDEQIEYVSFTLRDMARTNGMRVTYHFRDYKEIEKRFKQLAGVYKTNGMSFDFHPQVFDDIYRAYTLNNLKYKVILGMLKQFLNNNKGIEYKFYKWIGDRDKYFEFYDFLYSYEAFLKSFGKENYSIKFHIDHDAKHISEIIKFINSSFYKKMNSTSVAKRSNEQLMIYCNFLIHLGVVDQTIFTQASDSQTKDEDVNNTREEIIKDQTTEIKKEAPKSKNQQLYDFIKKDVSALPKQFYSDKEYKNGSILNIYQTVLIFDSYLNCEGKADENNQIEYLSFTMRDMARSCGVPIGLEFRNMNEVRGYFDVVKDMFKYKNQSWNIHPMIFDDVYDLYQNHRLKYKVILQKTKELLEKNRGLEYQYYSQLKKKIEYTDMLLFLSDYRQLMMKNNMDPKTIEFLPDHDAEYCLEMENIIYNNSLILKADFTFMMNAVNVLSNYHNFLVKIGLMDSKFQENKSLSENGSESHPSEVLTDRNKDESTLTGEFKQDEVTENISHDTEVPNLTNENESTKSNKIETQMTEVEIKEESVNDETESNLSEASDSMSDTDMQFVGLLKSEFPSGIRKGFVDYRRFENAWENTYKTTLNLTKDELFDRISNFTIYVNKSYYIPEQMLKEEARIKIQKFINNCFNNGKDIVYYDAIMNKFKSSFLDGSLISSPSLLRDYLKHYDTHNYAFEASYVLPYEGYACHIDQNIKQYMLDMGKPISNEKLLNHFDNLTSDVIKESMQSNDFIVNRNGQNAEKFPIELFYLDDKERNTIEGILNSEIQRFGYVSWKTLFDFIKQALPDLIERYSSMITDLGFRNAIAYLERNKYELSGSIFSSFDNIYDKNKILSEFGKTHEEYTIEDVENVIDEAVGSGIIDKLIGSSIRVSKTKFVSNQLVEFDIHKIDNFINSFYSGEYMTFKEVENYIALMPGSNYPWNLYLLESYLTVSSQTYTLLHKGFNKDGVYGAIIKKDSRFKNIDDVIIDAIAASNIEINVLETEDYIKSKGFVKSVNKKTIQDYVKKARVTRTRIAKD